MLRDPGLAEDATQEAYLTAFRCLRDLQEPGAFPAWLRRLVITAALNVRRSRRRTFLRLDDVPEVPVLDDTETSWTEQQRQRLAGALVALSSPERQLCDRRYHGRWTVARLAADAGIDEAAMRKRLQRIRDRLRKEMEVSEQRAIRPEDIRRDLPAKVVELLARPRLIDLPESPSARRSTICAPSMPASARSSCQRSSTSPKHARASATMRSTSNQASSIASTRSGSFATT